ncbi:hypothetical protein DIPPA_50180, partial [Diplonema papillatum]
MGTLPTWKCLIVLVVSVCLCSAEIRAYYPFEDNQMDWSTRAPVMDFGITERADGSFVDDSICGDTSFRLTNETTMQIVKILPNFPVSQTPFSLSMWVKHVVDDGTPVIFANGGMNGMVLIYNNSAEVRVAGQIYYGSDVPPLGVWTHHFVTFDGVGTYSSYSNGTLYETQACLPGARTGATKATHNMWFGLDVGEGFGVFHLDDVKIWDSVVPVSEAIACGLPGWTMPSTTSVPSSAPATDSPPTPVPWTWGPPTPAPATDPPTRDGIVGYYPMDHTAYDCHRKDEPCVAEGNADTALFSEDSICGNGSLFLNHTSQQLVFPKVAPFPYGAAPYSLSFWVKKLEYGQALLLECGDWARGYELWLNSLIAYLFPNSVIRGVWPAPLVGTDGWTHVFYTYDGEKISTYRNLTWYNTEVKTLENQIAAYTLKIWGVTVQGGNLGSALLDDLKFFDRVVTREEAYMCGLPEHTEAPDTNPPATAAPPTYAPTTAPSAAPATAAPATSAPATSAPATPAPATVAPATSAPATSAPATSAPATSAPATAAPATAAPATSAPATSAP